MVEKGRKGRLLAQPVPIAFSEREKEGEGGEG